MIITEKDSGRIVKLRADEVFTVHLKENPTTGYQWSVESAPGLEQIHDQFQAGEAIGAAGIHEFQFRAEEPGSYPLQLRHWRKWEGENSVIDRFVATFTVE